MTRQKAQHRGGKKRQHSPAKKASKYARTDCGNKNFKTIQPELNDLEIAIEKSVTFRGSNPVEIPLAIFLFHWNKLLDKGWLRSLFPSSCKKSLTEYETHIVGLLCSILVGHGNPWNAVGYAFGCDKRTITTGFKNFRKDIFTPRDNGIATKKINLKLRDIPLVLFGEGSSPNNLQQHDTSTPPGREPDLLQDKLSDAKVDLFSAAEPHYLTPTKRNQVQTPLAPNTPGTISKLGGTIMMSIISSAKKTKASLIHHTKQALGFHRDEESSQEQNESCQEGNERSVPSDESLKKQAIDLLKTKMISANNQMDSDVASLVVSFLDEIKRRSSDPVAIKVNYRVKSGYRTNQKMYVEVTKPRVSSTAGKLRYIREKGKSAMEYIKKICGVGNEELHAAVVHRLLEGYFGSASVASHDTILSVLDIIAIRELGCGNISTNQIIKILGGVRTLGNFTKKFMPSMLKKKICAEESKLQKVQYLQLELNTAKDKKASCVFYYISGMPLLVERLASSSVLDGTYEESIKFSNYNNTHIFFFGIDKAQDLIAMIRYGNRANGNTGHHSIPFAVAEDAAEDDSNLRRTLCQPDRVAFIQAMMDRNFHLFQLSFKENETATKLINAKSICVEFSCDNPTFHPSNLECHLIDSLDDLLFENASSEAIDNHLGPANNAEDRHLACRLNLQTRMLESRNGNHQLHLKLRMIRHKTVGEEGDIDDSYIGCEFYGLVNGNPSKVYSFRFDNSILCSQSQELSISATCNRIICIPAQDGKMVTMQGGQSTCGVKYPCPRCLRPLECAKFPEWMKQQFPQLLPPGAEISSYPLRKGSNSPIECFKRFQTLVGPNKGYTMAEKEITVAIRDACSSITKCPMYETPLDWISGDPLHLSQGIMTHLTEETAKMLKEILSGEGWAITKKDKYVEELTEFVLELPKTASYYAAKRHHANWKSQRTILVKKIGMAAIEDNSLNELQDRLQKMDEAQDLDVHLKDYSIMNRKIRGAKLFLSVLKGSDKKKGENLEEAEFLFLQGIRRYAGSFNKQHGSMELTNARGMKALEKRENIYHLVCNAFSSTNPEANIKVKKVMDWWILMANDLYEIGNILKSQKKMTPERIIKLKKHVVQYGVGWRQRITYKPPVFWKMHVLECCFMNFVETIRDSL